ncbi:hypothetical protein ACFWFQ_32765 [Nocardia salmonicida]
MFSELLLASRSPNDGAGALIGPYGRRWALRIEDRVLLVTTR